MAIPALPVWSIRPNWREGILERLEWLTDVLPSSSGAEQRRGLRLTPRRSFEVRFNPTGNERTFMDLWMNRLGSQQCLAPLWHDKAKMTATADAADTRLDFDNTFREFTTGGYAIVYVSAFKFEVVEIEGQDDTGIDLAAPLSAAWQRGSAVYPLRVSRIDYDGTLSALTSRVGAATLLFQVEEPNFYSLGDEDMMLYQGHPVLTIAPNRLDPLDQILTRLATMMDGRIGKRHVFDEGERAFSTSMYNWQVHGREQHHLFRQMLYRFNGRQKAIWIPTYNEDITLSDAAVTADTHLKIEHIGFGYVGGPASGREHVLLATSNGRKMLKINAMGASPGAGKERINLSTTVGGNAPAGRTASFVDVGRLDQDTVEITHHTDSEGTCECSAALKTFKNTRDPSGTIYHPIPIAIMSNSACGEAADESEVDNPCSTIFPGWTKRIYIECISYLYPGSVPNPYFDSGPGGSVSSGFMFNPEFGDGRTFSNPAISNFSRPANWYEVVHPLHPTHQGQLLYWTDYQPNGLLPWYWNCYFVEDPGEHTYQFDAQFPAGSGANTYESWYRVYTQMWDGPMVKVLEERAISLFGTTYLFTG